MEFDVLLLSVVGSVFTVIGVALIWGYVQVLQGGRRVEGRVVGIEYYTSTYRSNNQTRRQAYYRPVIEFFWNGRDYKMAGGGTSSMRYRLHDTVTVLVMADRQGDIKRAEIKGGTLVIVGGIFAAIGTAALMIAVQQFEAPANQVMALLGGVALAGALIRQWVGPFIKFEPYKPKPGGRLIDTDREFMAETAKNAIAGRAIGLVTLAMGVGLAYWGYSDLPAAGQAALQSDVIGFVQSVMDGQTPPSWDKKLILMGAGLGVSLMALYSLYYTARQSRLR